MIEAVAGKRPESIESLVGVKDTSGKEIPGSLTDFPLDPWGNAYLYVIINDQPVVFCLGKDNKFGGTDEDADEKYP